MSYLGNDPNDGDGLSSLLQGQINRYQYVATAQQTTFNAVYTPGFVDVYKNGVRLDIADYTATDGSTVVLGAGAAAGELINIVGQEAYPVADVYSPQEIDSLLTTKTDVGHSHAISSVTGLQSALDAKQATLVSGTNIKTINGSTLLGSGDFAVGTVTQVSASVPSFLSVQGSPVTSTGTIAISYSGQALPVANGGTGATTFTSGSYLKGAGTGAVTAQQGIPAGDITSGLVATARGGTNSSSTPTAGAIAYGTGSSYAFTQAGTAGQVLTSTGSSAPIWSPPESGGVAFSVF